MQTNIKAGDLVRFRPALNSEGRACDPKRCGLQEGSVYRVWEVDSNGCLIVVVGVGGFNASDFELVEPYSGARVGEVLPHPVKQKAGDLVRYMPTSTTQGWSYPDPVYGLQYGHVYRIVGVDAKGYLSFGKGIGGKNPIDFEVVDSEYCGPISEAIPAPNDGKWYASEDDPNYYTRFAIGDLVRYSSGRAPLNTGEIACVLGPRDGHVYRVVGIQGRRFLCLDGDPKRGYGHFEFEAVNPDYTGVVSEICPYPTAKG